jgi:subtilisin family serine protease
MFACTPRFRLLALGALGALVVLLFGGLPPRTDRVGAQEPQQTWIVVRPGAGTARAPAARAAVAADRQQLGRAGLQVRADLDAGVWVVRGTRAQVAALKAAQPDLLVGRDKVLRVPEEPVTLAPAQEADEPVCASTDAACPLQWDLSREEGINIPDAWRVTRGSGTVTVAVLDTGVTAAHEAVGQNYNLDASRSFVEYVPELCPADRDTWSSPDDFYGHGTWVATHIAGRSGALMTGIAPETTLLNVRVLGACGFGFFSWILTGMQYAAEAGARVINMSLGGPVCADGFVPGSVYCNSPEADFEIALWQAMENMVTSLTESGTLVVASAGNDHVRLDARGRVATDGSLYISPPSCPPEARGHPCKDLRGLADMPAGVPGVLAVSATNRVTVIGRLAETKWGQFGRGRREQLTYYSNYGERTDLSAPGGARAYNVPSFDCLSPVCARLGESTPGAHDNTGAFGAWGTDAAGRPCATCYAFVQGTSMSAPQVAGVAALVLATRRGLGVDELIAHVKRTARPFADYNSTPAIAGFPASRWYRYNVDYWGPGISPRLMGAGLIDAARAVGAPGNGAPPSVGAPPTTRPPGISLPQTAAPPDVAVEEE